MEIDDIKKLVELMEERGVVELEMEDRKGKIRLVRENHRVSAPLPSGPPPLPTVSAPTPQMPAATTTIEPPPTEPAPPMGTAIPSPMVGTFYRAPNPDAKPYVDVGEVVEKGDVICIIEAMKMMNEIQAEIRGRVLRVLVENGQPVEYGQPLFMLEPL
jgi:acetyl-CoA carboxylase biotin carboxyl carrier protein